MRHGGIPHFNTRQEISESDGTLRYVRLRHAEARMKPADKSLSCRGITKAAYHEEDYKEERIGWINSAEYTP